MSKADCSAPLLPPWCRLPDGRIPGLVACDLDGTLIAADSQELWHQWLIERGYAGTNLQAVIDRMHADYVAGTLDLPAMLSRAADNENKLTGQARRKELARFVKDVIAPTRFLEALAFLKSVQAAGIPLVIISATASFVVRAAAACLNVPEKDVIAVDLEEIDGRLTGRILGTPSFQSGKIIRLQDRLDQINAGRSADQALALSDVFFLTDSANDLPLVEAAGGAALVNPDQKLKACGLARGIEILEWHPIG